MARSPWLAAAGRRSVECLARIRDLDARAKDFRHVTAEQLLDLGADHEEDLPEAGPRRIVHAIIE